MRTNNRDKDWKNLGVLRMPKLHAADYPNADAVIQQALEDKSNSKETVDIILANPPTPDGELWIRTQHRVGRRTRENMVWPQVSLAQMAALLYPIYKVKIIDANAERMKWPEFITFLDKYRPRYYLTQLTGPTLENDMYGCFLAKARGATTIAFGTHITPLPLETLQSYPVLDIAIVGEPDLTIRDLLDHLEGKIDQRPHDIRKLFSTDPVYKTTVDENGRVDMHEIPGICWRKGKEIVLNNTRPFIKNLDDLPMPLHNLLPLDKYRMPLIKGPFSFIVTSRGCPEACTFCIKHVSYQNCTRLRSPELLVEEMWQLRDLGISNIHMYADLFTVNRDQVVKLCNLMIREKINIRWTCNSRVDYIDEEMLHLMEKAGNWLISWGIESSNENILKNVRKGIEPEKVEKALTWSRKAGIKNWGYFIIGLPGETEETIRETIDFSKRLPLDIALFHVAAPHPGTPFFFEVLKEGWFRAGTSWEQVDMDKETVLDYPGLSAERLLYWQNRAFREWALRPGPIFTYLKMLLSDTSTLKSALNVGLQHLSWTPSKKDN
jgi:radical SAM superfamily enzyme YgiQ (UPF0313 family)